MKKRIFTVLVGAGMLLVSCKKDHTTPTTTATTPSGTTTTISTVPPPAAPPAANDTTKGYLKLELADAAVTSATDDILIEFSPASSPAYIVNQDARTFAGDGIVSLSSMSSDGVQLAINSLPLLTSGTTIPLMVKANNSGLYNLKLTAVSGIPSNIDIWLKDKMMKDSLDIKLYPSYAFDITTTDTSTYGGNRFSVVLRAH
jgi:hypothetical protein